jgi:hypothetical protein
MPPRQITRIDRDKIFSIICKTPRVKTAAVRGGAAARGSRFAIFFEEITEFAFSNFFKPTMESSGLVCCQRKPRGNLQMLRFGVCTRKITWVRLDAGGGSCSIVNKDKKNARQHEAGGHSWQFLSSGPGGPPGDQNAWL